MEISALANETLLAVFSFLTREDLLQCRAVCNRWASLAQHATLWSGLKVDTEKCNPKLLSAILRFAPCLGRLNVNCETDPLSSLWSTLLSTACAISVLDFVISPANAFDAALVISRHASLGRLKGLHLRFVDGLGSANSQEWERCLCGFFMQVSHTQELEEVSFDANFDDDLMDDAIAEFAKRVGRAPAGAPVSPSFKRLMLRSFDFFGQLLLQWHADTLEDVRVVEPSENGAELALLLSRLPRLRKLSCAPLENIETLLQCPSLKGLKLFVYPIRDSVDESRLLKACAYLRVAVSTQLEHFSLCPTAEGQDSFLKLLPCVEGKEGTAVALRSISMDFAYTSDEAAWDALTQQRLVDVLLRLSRLTLLDLDSMPTPALLQALDGRTVPELTQLVVAEISEDCDHQFIHSEAVRTLLRNYPRLHVIMKFVQLPDDCGCDFCEEGCHAVPPKAWCMLFGHEAGARCDVPHGRYYHYDDEELKECVAFRISTN